MDRDSNGLPAKPACFPAIGKIRCDCEMTMKKYECASRRTFWLQAKTVADLPDDSARREYMLGVSAHDRPMLRRAALELLGRS